MDRFWMDIQYIKGVGPKRKKQFNRLGIKTVFDLLWYLPRTYINREHRDSIAQLQPGENINIKGRVVSTHNFRTRRGMSIFKALLADNSGTVQAVWFNQPYIGNTIKTDAEVFVSGRLKNNYGDLEINVNDYEVIEGDELNFKVLPVYALTEGLNQKAIRKAVLVVLKEYLHYYQDIFSDEIKEQYGLGDIYSAFVNIHFPSGRDEYLQARRRLAFEELFLFQLSIRNQRQLPGNGSFVVHKEKTGLVADVVAKLPFKLTGAQQRVLNEIFTDMAADMQMNRLLQGDVGSGKTAVAAISMAKSVASGYQAAMMAPTEILAEQHFKSVQGFFRETDVVIACLTGSTPAAEKAMIVEALVTGEIDIIVGTHALIQETVSFQRLGLAIIDEQHRFGVKQRALLGNKGLSPDILVMTATPIPRTLALTVYGDLQVSVIDELPPGRKPVKTVYIKEEERYRIYNFMREEMKHSAQGYVVCPLVEESETQDLIAATTLYDELKTEVFPEYKVGLIHGRLKPGEKDYIMKMFKNGTIQILVATTVIEVGVDVPQASIMVIEQAHRFGLSQLHQLRGRVGRGERQSYCFLIGNPKTDEAFQRLKAMERTNDGFKLAQEDLIIRGPGDFWGVRQHGLDQLKAANLIRDKEIINQSRELAKDLAAKGISAEWDIYIKAKFNTGPNIVQN